MRLDARFLQGTLSVADPLLALDRLKLSLVADPSLARAEATLTTILGQTAETSETALSANQALAAGKRFLTAAVPRSANSLTRSTVLMPWGLFALSIVWSRWGQ